MMTLATESLLLPFKTGLFTGAGLIIAIGNQNAFVLSQGLRRQYGVAVAALCASIDIVLISMGVMGMGLVIDQHPIFMDIALWGGAAFLFAYGCKALFNALHPQALSTAGNKSTALKATLITCLAVSLLNPHVYLDTVMLLGSIGGRYSEAGQVAFIAGASLASVVWFFGLALGARVLAPLFSRPTAWRVLDLLVCGFMWSVAASLVLLKM